MNGNTKTRILLSTNNQLRKFFFIAPLKDGSISFGSSLTMMPQKMMLGEIKILNEPQSGEFRFNYSDGVEIDPALSHFTYHPPSQDRTAVVHLRSDKGEYIFRQPADCLNDMSGFKRILTIIPRKPSDLPPFQRKITANDLIIPVDPFMVPDAEKPFCVEVFLCKKDFDYNKLFIKDVSFAIRGICENRDYRLIIIFYHKREFKVWSKFEVFIPFVEGLA